MHSASLETRMRVARSLRIGPCKITIEDDCLERQLLEENSNSRLESHGYRRVPRPDRIMENGKYERPDRGEGFEEDVSVTLSNKLLSDILQLSYPCALKSKEWRRSTSMVAIHAALWPSFADYTVAFVGYQLMANERLGDGAKPMFCDWQCDELLKRDTLGKWTDVLVSVGLGKGRFILRDNQLLDESGSLIRKIAT